MIQWLLDGSALLVGSALLNPSTGAWTPLPLYPESRVAVGTRGRIATLDLLEGDVPHVRILAGPEGAPSTRLPEGTTSQGFIWAHEFVGDEVYVHKVEADTGDVSCWRVSEGLAQPLETCLEGGFVAVDGITPTRDGVVIDSHGEGHPGVDLYRWTGAAMEPVALPWVDLYPFGPLTLLPRTDGSFDILTPCPLGPDRPCLTEVGQDADELPMRWYRWTPGQAPVERAVGKKAEIAPDPSSERVAWERRGKVCVGEPDQRPRCFKVPG